jgi:SAM-dependent methyltransferase
MSYENINTTAYWDGRFGSGHWEAVGGRTQTSQFADAQLRRMRVPRTFSGTLLDFGCGLGDAFPVYRAAFPNAKLIGMDLSIAAIERCRAQFGHLAEFQQGDHTAVPSVDVIVTSNVLEHVSDPISVAHALRGRCQSLYIIVPFREWPRIEEHVHTFEVESFRDVGPHDTAVFSSPGWSQYGWKPLWLNIYLKNLIRPFVGREKVRRRLQIIYRFDCNGF